MSSRRYFFMLLTLVAANLFLTWFLAILPAQDLPQHLGYVRIFLDYARPDRRFQEFFALPKHFEPYYSIYFILTWLSRLTSLQFALRSLVSIYILGIYFGSHLLIAASRRTAQTRLLDPQWPALLATLGVWNSPFVMGFLSFVLCAPWFLIGLAGTVGMLGPYRRRYDFVCAGLGAILLPSLHIAAGGFFLMFLILLGITCLARLRRRVLILLWPLGVLLLTTFLWSRLGGLGAGSLSRLNWQSAIRHAVGFDILTWLFQIDWNDPTLVLNNILWTLLGPYRMSSWLFLAAALGFVAYRIRQNAHFATEPTLLNKAALIFALLGCLCPWGIQVPTEMTFISIRMLSLGLAVLVCTVDFRWFENVAAQRWLLGGCLLLIAHFAQRAISFNQEAADAQQLLARVAPNKIVSSLVFHGKSAAFNKQFRLTHFLPMYYMIDHGGLSTQFWARYTEHLPIDYKPGKRLPHPPDWHPEQFHPASLTGVDYLLMQSATDEDTDEVRAASARTSALLFERAVQVTCSRLWCLYQLEK